MPDPGSPAPRGLRAAVRRLRPAAAPARAKAPTDYGFVVVVAPGRSGSTLIQGMLNEIPGTLVRGENNLYLYGIYQAYRDFLAFQELHRSNRHRQLISPFYGLMELRKGMWVRFVRNLFVTGALGAESPQEVQRLGFKEVLWHRVTAADTEGFFDFLDAALPGVRYVLNTRDPEVVVGSGFWTGQDRDKAIAKVERVHEIQAFLRTTRPERVFDTRYEIVTGEDVAARDAQLSGLIEFVTGSPASRDVLARVAGALETGYGPHPFGESRSDGLGATPPPEE